MDENMKEAPEFVAQEQLDDNLINAIIEKIMSNDVLVDAILKRLVDKLESTRNKKN